MSFWGTASLISSGGGVAQVNSDGSVTITPAAAKTTTIASGGLTISAGGLSTKGTFASPGVDTSATAATVVLAAGSNSGINDSNVFVDFWRSNSRLGVIGFQGGIGITIAGHAQVFSDLLFHVNGYRAIMDNSGNLYQSGNILFGGTANGQACGLKTLTELTTIAAAATTDTAIQIPANAILLGATVRVVTVIPTAATFTVTGATSGTAFQTGASVSTAAGSTDQGTKSCPFLNTAAQSIRITPNLAPAAATGQVRVAIYYVEVTPPTA